METLAFYSYKGGVGRSLLLANAARFLATLGKGVVALDLDFEAPGLHYKLGASSANKKKRARTGGAVPYLVATAQDASSPPPLRHHLIDIPVPPEGGGWLRLMPAGPAPEHAYWTALKELGERLRLDDPSGRSLLAVLDLQARIQEELRPDYLLIDARTGVTEIGGLATTILADTVVCMFVANRESLDGTITVVEALKKAPRLKGQGQVRVIPVIRHMGGSYISDRRLADSARRLLELGEGWTRPGADQPKLFALPHDEAVGAEERIIGGETTASAFSPLYESYLELFQKLFPDSADQAREALARLKAVAAIKDELTPRIRQTIALEHFHPWKYSAVQEGVLYVSDEAGPDETQYADLMCYDADGEPLMAVEYIADRTPDEALDFWVYTVLRCVVLLVPREYGRTERQIYTRAPAQRREPSHPYGRYVDLRRADRTDLPLPREFDLFPDVGVRSVESMLEGLRHGEADIVPFLVDKWREEIGAEGHHGRRPPSLWPSQAQRILEGLSSTEDLACVEHILRYITADSASHHAEMEELFAPLYWRLPVDAIASHVSSNMPLSLAGYRLVAQDLMGLRFDPEAVALQESRALAERLRSETESSDDAAYGYPWDWKLIELRKELSPVFVLEDAFRQDREWHGTVEEAIAKSRLKKGGEENETADLRKKIKRMIDRRELSIHDLLGQYDTRYQIRLYPLTIDIAAELLRIRSRYVKGVVFIYLSVNALAHQARDLDGHAGYGFAPLSKTSPIQPESPVHLSLVQAFAYQLIRRIDDSNLLAALETLSRYQPAPYRFWSSMRDMPLEALRELLMRARASPVALDLP